MQIRDLSQFLFDDLQKTQHMHFYELTYSINAEAYENPIILTMVLTQHAGDIPLLKMEVLMDQS